MTEADRVIVEQMISQRVKEAVEAAIGKGAANGNAAVLRRDIAFELPAAMRVNGARTEQGAGPDSDVANTQVGEHGMRASDAWGWNRVTATNIMLNNVYIGYDGKMAEYSSASALTIGTTPTIVYAIVTWSKTDGEITGISSVTFATTTDWDTARNPVLDGEGKQTALHVPVAKFKYATGTWGSTIQCQKRYLDGALMFAAKTTASDAPPQLWDGRFNESGNLEVYCGATTSVTVRTSAGDLTWATPTSAGWVDMGGPTGNVWLIDDNGNLSIGFYSEVPSYASGVTGVNVGLAYGGTYEKLFHGAYCRPLPPGDATNTALVWSPETVAWVPAPPGNNLPSGDSTHIALKWDTTNSVWVKAEPVEADDSASTSATRYVTSISASSTPGVLLKYTTAPATGLTADDFESIDVYVPGAEWDGDGIQFKKRTLKVLKTTAAATDSDRIDFAPYPD